MNVANASVELIESEYPVLIHQYGLRADSGGAGKYRGGQGICREWELREGHATFVMRADRSRHAPWGLHGGGPGATARTVLNPQAEARELPPKSEFRIERGDRVLHQQAAGGGYGQAYERDPGQVWQDWRNEKITEHHAYEAYGVVIRNGAVDTAATQARRATGRDRTATGPAHR